MRYRDLKVIAQIKNDDRMARPIPLLGIDGDERATTDLTVQDAWNARDACVCSTGMINDLGFTVYPKEYDPEKQD